VTAISQQIISHQRTFRSPHGGFWVSIVVLLVWVVALIWAMGRPTVSLDETRGLFARDSVDAPFAWTSSEVVIPVRSGTGPTLFAITLAAGDWPGRTPVSAALSAAEWPSTALVVEDQPRRLLVLLPPNAQSVMLETRADHGPGSDRRYLGVRLYSASAQATGLPLLALGASLIWASLALAAALILWWCGTSGWGLVAGVTLLGLGLRLFQLDTLPVGFFQDEAVSAVDAWSLLQTGRDHLGHMWPLGAFESFGDWVSPLLIYTQLPSVALLGPGPLGARLPAALAGALAIPILYAIGRELALPGWAAALAGLAAALSPWQIIRSRVASPPALVPLCWALVLLAGLHLIRKRDRRAALLLALAAGLGLYSYPTMKLAVPLLAACAVLLAVAVGIQRNWWPVIADLLRRWWPAALLVIALWLPFAQVTLFNPDSDMRASRKFLQADTPIDWATQWLDGYTTYLRPEFYYVTGDPANGSDLGVQLSIELPLVLLGAAALIWGALGIRATDRTRVVQYRLVVLALLIAPLPASLMSPNPHLTRALIVAPMYALLVGIGAGVLAQGSGWKLIGGRALVAILALGMLLQGGMRYDDYRERFPVLTAKKYQDGTREAFERVVALAPSYDEVWVDDQMPFPYIYILAAGGVPAAQAQATIIVERPGTTFNTVRQVGKYRFTDVKPIPNDLPALVATVNSLGDPGFLIQEWRDQGKRVLLLRRMR